MECLFCKFEIEDDSIFCDQCGKEVFICPKCSKPGRGKSKDEKKAIGVKGASKLRLLNKNLGLDLEVDKNVLIGRTEGDFINAFGKYKQLSGKHLEIKFDSNSSWTVTDLDSTNGTKYNNTKLTPFQPQVLSDKSYLCIANLEFYVQISYKLSKGKTGTERI